MDARQRIARFRRQLEQEPQSRVFAPLADLLARTGRLEEALQLLSRGVARHPGYLSAQVIQGRLLLEAGRRDEAVAVLQEVLRRDGQNVVVLELLAEDAHKRGRRDLAVSCLRKLADLDPENPRWTRDLARLRAEETLQARADAPVDEDANGGFATLTLVDIYVQQGYLRHALAALRTMAEQEPERDEVQARIAALEERLAADPDVGEEPEPSLGGVVPPVDPTVDPTSGPTSDPTSDPTSGPPIQAEDRAARRAEEKRRFARWLDSVQAKQETGREVEP